MSDNLTIKAYLVVRANATMRVVKQNPRLGIDEVAFPITVVIPKMWGRVQTTRIDVILPEPPEARVTVGDPEMAPEPHYPCPDDGTCHHECSGGFCWRVAHAEPLSDVFPKNEWPKDIRQLNETNDPRPKWNSQP